MRHKDREITDITKIAEVLEKSDACHIAMNDGEYPYLVTMNYGYEAEEGKITLWFHCAKAGKKLSVLRNNPKVCFSVDCGHEYIKHDPEMYCTVNYESIVGFGEISEVLDDGEKAKGIALLLRHHNCEDGFVLTENHMKSTCILKIVSENFTGKKKNYIPKT